MEQKWFMLFSRGMHGTLQCLFLQCLFLQCCKCCAKSFGRGFQSFETSHSLTLLYPHTESPKCLSQPSTQTPPWLCPTGQSGMLCDSTEDKGCWSSCVLLAFPIYLAWRPYCLFWNCCFIPFGGYLWSVSLPILPHLCESFRFIHFSLSPSLDVLRR